MWTELLGALALVFILEGILPLANPGWLRRALVALAQLDDAALRFIGASSLLAGSVLLYLVR